MTSSQRTRWFLVALCVAALFAFAPEVLACPNCVDPTAKSAKAFGWTTLLLGAVPVSFAGAVSWWLYRSARRHAASSSTTP